VRKRKGTKMGNERGGVHPSPGTPLQDAEVRWKQQDPTRDAELVDMRDPLRVLAEEEGYQEMLVRVAGLPSEKMRAVVAMRWLAGMSTAEIAAALGAEEPDVRFQLSYAGRVL